MQSTKSALTFDLLVDGEVGEPLTVALSGDDLCLQWNDSSEGALRAMLDMFSSSSENHRELRIGKIFENDLYLVEREGIFSFKSTAEGREADLMRIDLTSGMVKALVAALVDAIDSL